MEIVVFSVLNLVFIGSSIFFYKKYNQELEKNKGSFKLEADLESSKNNENHLINNISECKKNIEDLNKKLLESEKDKSTFAEKNNNSLKEIEKLQQFKLLNENLKEEKNKLELSISVLQEKNNSLNDILKEKLNIEEENNNLKKENNKLNTDVNLYEQKYQQIEKILKQKEDDFTKMKEEFLTNFKNISNETIKMQTEDFNKKQTEGLNILLKPFETEIKDFKVKIEAYNKDSIEKNISLGEHIKGLTSLNQEISKEAKNLTEALKGNKKIQGNWGEMQLENLFQIIGWNEGSEYEKQARFSDEDGITKIPDFIVRLPDNRQVVIDVKVSLNNYIRYTEEKELIEKEKSMKMYISDIKKHIKELSEKNYQKELKERSLDFVFIFMPIEVAYLEALSFDNKLYEEAFYNNIAIVTPSSLFPILRTINTLWKIEKQNKNTLAIAEVGGKLYDKLYTFLEKMEKIDKGLISAKNNYDDAFKLLATGNGNVLKQASELKDLGVKANKEITIEYETTLLNYVEAE